MCGETGNNNSCIAEILRKILLLQRNENDTDCPNGCDKPYLGPTPQNICYNTRPIQLYNCCTGKPWSFDVALENNVSCISDVFRVESLDNNCCTCRMLHYDTEKNTLLNTGNFCTIDLRCCGAIRCLPDTSIDLCNN